LRAAGFRHRNGFIRDACRGAVWTGFDVFCCLLQSVASVIYRFAVNKIYRLYRFWFVAIGHSFLGKKSIYNRRNAFAAVIRLYKQLLDGQIIPHQKDRIEKLS
jgi:hypothetical protein